MKKWWKKFQEKFSSSHIQPDSEKKVTDPSVDGNFFQYYTYGGNTTVRYVLYVLLERDCLPYPHVKYGYNLTWVNFPHFI